MTEYKAAHHRSNDDYRQADSHVTYATSGVCSTASCWEAPAFVVTVVVWDPAGPSPQRTSSREQCWTHALCVAATVDALVLDGVLPEGSYAEQVVCEAVSPVLDMDAVLAARVVRPQAGVPA